jgi:MoaA/NifB/PqqE/SkfB family radical SAM enzyme
MMQDKKSIKRIVNQIKAKLDATFLSDRMISFPSTYFIGLSIVCDIKCPYCPRQFYTKEVDHGFMDFDGFLNMSEFLEYCDEANFFGLGEPFLHPRFFDFLKEAKKRGCRITTSTHGMSLKPEVIEQIVDLGLDQLAISIDGADKKTFELLREGAVFETVIENVLKLQNLKKLKGQTVPEIHIATAVSTHNVKQLDKIVKLGKKLGVSRIVFTDLIIVDQKKAEVSVSRTDLFWKNFQKAERLGKKYGIDILYFYQNPFPWKKSHLPEIDTKNRRFACRDPWKTCILDRKGNMKPCCYYPPNTGNVFNTPLPEVINNKENRELRRLLIKGDLPKCCLDCGMLLEITREESEIALNEARELYKHEKPGIPDNTQKELEGLFREYEKKIRKTYTAGVNND